MIIGKARSYSINEEVDSVQFDDLATIKARKSQSRTSQQDVQLQPKSSLHFLLPLSGLRHTRKVNEWLQQGEGGLVVSAWRGKLRTRAPSSPASAPGHWWGWTGGTSAPLVPFLEKTVPASSLILGSRSFCPNFCFIDFATTHL